MAAAVALRQQSAVNLQVCFVNDSSSDKDSDAEDSRTETSLDTPLSPVVRNPPALTCVTQHPPPPHSHLCYATPH